MLDSHDIGVGRFYATAEHGVVEVIRRFHWGSRNDPLPGFDVLPVTADKVLTLESPKYFLCEVHPKNER